MTQSQLPSNQEIGFSRRITSIAGGGLVLMGIAFFLNQFFHTAWLALVIFPLVGIILFIEGIQFKKPGLSIIALICICIGLGAFLSFYILVNASVVFRVGTSIIAVGVSWYVVTLATKLFTEKKKAAWWAMIPGSIFMGVGLALAFTQVRVMDFVFTICLFLGLSMIVWGLATKLIGLIIPGSIIAVVGPGILLAWGDNTPSNPLAQTGEMLVWFALGWVLIIVFARILMNKFVWWPIIPGGILAAVGWGLFIGGNPSSALTFIGNTGSIGLVIVGLYLLLLRRGIQK